MSDPVMSRPSNIAILVLAAGWSSRMGALKPLLPFGNGRSYGDTCQNHGGTVVDMRSMNGILSFSGETG